MGSVENIEKQVVTKILKKVLKEKLNDKLKFEKIKKLNHICIPNMRILKIYRELIEEEKLIESELIFSLLRKQRARSISGISAITILMKPYACPSDCVYCPTEVKMPKSYLSDEPAVMRAVLNKWDPKKQVKCRLKALYLMGHPIDKCEMIILGGTFSFYKDDYIRKYVLEMYNALNEADSDNLGLAEDINETAKHRAVGLSIETRPDFITEKEIKRLRELGVTKVEMGVQSLNDKVLDLVKRGHKVEATRQATKLLRDAGFKIHYHIMPNLPGSTLDIDRNVFDELFSDQDFKPDMLKIYPCVVTRNTELEKWEKEDKYKTYTDDVLIDLLTEIKQKVPFYCRIMRLGRDIPAPDIQAGNQITNIREVVRDKMKEKGQSCKCQRCREIGFRSEKLNKIILKRFDYDASSGKEIYLEFQDEETKILLAFLRLRIPSQYFSKEKHFLEVLEKTAIIRELHTYGFALEVDKRQDSATQHKGYGRRLMIEAERIVKEEFELDRVAVISGVGVRSYYRKLGYKLEDSYMIKGV